MLFETTVISKTNDMVIILLSIITTRNIIDIEFEYYYKIDTPNIIYEVFIKEVMYLPKKLFLFNLKPLTKKDTRIIKISSLSNKH
jgi:hypothetical protein